MEEYWFDIVATFELFHMCNKMSDVRLSNASPTLERVDRRTDHTRPSIRKNLFGTTIDREEFNKEFEEKMQEEQRSFAERWSYDVAKDIPLSSGDCQWELVKNSDLPAYYSRPPHIRRPRCDRENVEFKENHNHYLANSDSGSEPSDAVGSERQSDSDDTTSRPRKRPASSDSSCQCLSKKVHTSTDASDDDEDEHKSAGAQELTPIKPDPNAKSL